MFTFLSSLFTSAKAYPKLAIVILLVGSSLAWKSVDGVISYVGSIINLYDYFEMKRQEFIDYPSIDHKSLYG